MKREACSEFYMSLVGIHFSIVRVLAVRKKKKTYFITKDLFSLSLDHDLITILTLVLFIQ
ncbi:hypothetical protein BDC45DRAFT_492789 [Circinella umbellata]|nr:hypothetical protein BDC45DRAFT_492789 [Circinella umbellata]